MAQVSEVEYFVRLIEALDPWLGQVVIVGGWAHRLYRLHPLGQPLDYEPLGTFDTDIAVPLNLPATGEQLRARLLEKNFHEELMGDTQPPAAHYRVESGDNSFYAEFLTPLVGGEIKRGGVRDVTACVSGVSVQKLRHLELMLQNPWAVTIAAALGYPTPTPRRILVPNPAAFLVQKILIQKRRPRDKRAKDILYIHDTIETFGANLAAIRDQWQTNVRTTLHARVARQVERAPQDHFGEVHDYIREAARIAVGRNLTPETVRELCAFGWEQIFLA
ncbi:MAG TPA: GSU2403 family nucleotidyltransferase fold protein [Candidatus Aquilonibacter sp.]|nr:GSU2403 family nucleotidyltransferase fold protein [Candidatus Aquilonibacter sp.]